MPPILGWTVRVASEADIEVTRNGAWAAWKTRQAWRRVWQSLALVPVVALIFGFIYFLRLRAERTRQQILTVERNRMASDLHDTLEQHLAGARVMLNSAVSFFPNVPEGVKKAVGDANEILAHAKVELRARIFDLRNEGLFDKGVADVLKSFIGKIGTSGVVKTRTMLRGLPQHLPKSAFSELLFIVQEAVTNAVKHGKAKNILLVSDPEPGGFRLRILNDGEPFDPDAV